MVTNEVNEHIWTSELKSDWFMALKTYSNNGEIKRKDLSLAGQTF